MASKGLRLVVTGGIGSGKSTVMDLLRRRGFRVVDADLLARETLEPEGAAFDAVAARWPEVVVAGEVDRAALARIVFADRRELEALEALIHPHVRRRLLELDAEAGPAPLAVEVSVPKVLPPGWPVLVVEAPVDVRVARVVERGADLEDTRRRLAHQPTDDEWRSLATFVLPNDGDVETLASRLDEVLAALEPVPLRDEPRV